MAAVQLKNDTDLEFKDISSERFRAYDFPGGGQVMVHAPQWLHVSRAGGHRVLDEAGTSHYIPKGWIHLSWQVREGQPNFVA